MREGLRTSPQPPAPHCQRLDGAFNGRVPHLARSSAPTYWRRLACDQTTKMDQLIKPQALLCTLLLLATARWCCSWQCDFTAVFRAAVMPSAVFLPQQWAVVQLSVAIRWQY